MEEKTLYIIMMQRNHKKEGITVDPIFASTNLTRVENQLDEYLRHDKAEGAYEVKRCILSGFTKFKNVEFYYNVQKVERFE